MKAFKKELLKEWWNNNLDYLPLGAKWRGKWQRGRVKEMIKQIDERALDIEIAQKIFDRKVKVGTRTEYLDYGGDVECPELQMCVEIHKNGSWDGKSDWEEYEALPNYSTDLKDVWSIIDHLSPDDTGYELSVQQEINEGFAGIHVTFNGTQVSSEGEGSSVPALICKAVLKATNANQ